MDELEEQVRSVVPEADLQTEEPAMRQALELAFKAAASEATILLRGESGTGKGVLARAIHARSPRAAGPFVTVHCPSLSAELLESELFGHVRGRLHRGGQGHGGQGAGRRGGHAVPRRDRRPAAGASAEAAAAAAGEALRARRRDADARAATCASWRPRTAIWRPQSPPGKFREDLFYRLNVIEVTLPPLRQRHADMLPLAEHLLCVFRPPGGQDADRLHRRGPRGPGAIIRGRATSASCATPSSAACILATRPQIGLADLPAQLGAPPRPGSRSAAA